MTETKTYNGWTNYETWAVVLWMNNEEDSYLYCRELARECWRTAGNHDVWTRSEEARFGLADRLKDQYEEAMPDVQGVWADLLQAALSEVNWSEIANAWLEDEGLDGYEPA